MPLLFFHNLQKDMCSAKMFNVILIYTLKVSGWNFQPYKKGVRYDNT